MHNKAAEILFQYPKQTIIVHLKGLARVLINPGLDINCLMLNSQNSLSGCAAKDAKNLIDGLKLKFSYMNKFQSIVATWSIILLIATYLGALIGLWILFRQGDWRILTLLLTLTAYFSILSAGGESVSRFRIPFLPFLAIMASIGITSIYESITHIASSRKHYPDR